MIKSVNKKPGVFKDMPFPHEGFRFFELYADENLYGYISLDLRFPPACLLHLEILKWNYRIFKQAIKTDWPFTEKLVRNLGCDKIVLTKEGNLLSNRSSLKLAKRCGFNEPIEFIQSIKEL